MPLAAVLLPLAEMAANASFVAGFILGVKVTMWAYRHLRKYF